MGVGLHTSHIEWGVLASMPPLVGKPASQPGPLVGPGSGLQAPPARRRLSPVHAGSRRLSPARTGQPAPQPGPRTGIRRLSPVHRTASGASARSTARACRRLSPVRAYDTSVGDPSPMARGHAGGQDCNTRIPPEMKP